MQSSKQSESTKIVEPQASLEVDNDDKYTKVQQDQAKPKVWHKNFSKPSSKFFSDVTPINITQVNKKGGDKDLLKVPQKQNEERKSAHSDRSDAKTSATSDNSNKLTV